MKILKSWLNDWIDIENISNPEISELDIFSMSIQSLSQDFNIFIKTALKTLGHFHKSF